MQSRFVETEAEALVARYAARGVPRNLALRVYTTRLLGGDPKLVLHGGGNTSVKLRMPDLMGREVDVLCVKGSGADMAVIEPAGLPAVRLAELRLLLERDATSDEEMVKAQRANLLDPMAPNPSVETLAARLHSAALCRSHPRHRGAEPDRPSRWRRTRRRALRRPHGYRALHHAGLRPRQGGGASVRHRARRDRPHPAQARHLHVRGQRA